MPINFDCACGQPLTVDDTHAGLAVNCPSCGRSPTVPHPLPEAAQPAGAPRANPRPWDKRQPAEEPPADPNNPFGFTSPADTARERDRQAREREAGNGTSGRSLEGSVINGGMAGGVLAMLIAVVWFVVGFLVLDVIFFYPPILFIIGLVAFFKGLAQGAKR